MTSLPNSPAARDIANLLHPYTDARRHAEIGPIVIERGEGIHVFDDAGNTYVEAMSGLWSVAVGFGEKRLAEAAARQLWKLPFYHSFSSKSNNPAIDLGERLVAMSPPIEASHDLGARGGRTAAKVVLPLSFPGLVAGSIFTFSLTLGDYITPILVGGPGSDFIGNVVYSNVGIANNVPFAAAFASVPLIIMALYLLAARRLGAFDAL